MSESIYTSYALYWIHLPEHTDPETQGYIGITCDIKRRIREHKNPNSRSRVSKAIRKYGSRIVIDVLMKGLSKNNAITLEEQYRPSKMCGWNITEGGGIPPSARGRICTEEHKAKVRESKLAKTLSPETRKKLSEANRRRTQSPKARKKISETRRGKTGSAAGGFRGWYQDPFGNKYESIREASESMGISVDSVRSFFLERTHDSITNNRLRRNRYLQMLEASGVPVLGKSPTQIGFLFIPKL